MRYISLRPRADAAFAKRTASRFEIPDVEADLQGRL